MKNYGAITPHGAFDDTGGTSSSANKKDDRNGNSSSSTVWKWSSNGNGEPQALINAIETFKGVAKINQSDYIGSSWCTNGNEINNNPECNENNLPKKVFQQYLSLKTSNKRNPDIFNINTGKNENFIFENPSEMESGSGQQKSTSFSFESLLFSIMRKFQQLTGSFSYSLPFHRLPLLFWATIFFALITQIDRVSCDESEFFVNNFNPNMEMTTPEFDYASRGKKKFGDKCDSTLECGFPGSICDQKKKQCQCTEDLPITNHLDKCGKEATINETCFFNEQCEAFHIETYCHDGRCNCRFEMSPVFNKDNQFVECKGSSSKRAPETYLDPAMIGVLVGMALMFVIICVVLRLFSQARWRENRTIFNTPNPRLMNVSLLRDSKLLHGQERRGSRMSVRVPSRQPSMASLRPHSPNPSLGSRPGSRGSSSTSIKSNRSIHGHVNGSNNERKGSTTHSSHQPLMAASANITSNPTAENITVEIVKPES